ncbi:unnamed protein product [Heterosigma akashiwo]
MKPIDTTRFIVREDKTFLLGPTPNPNLKTEFESHANFDGKGCIKMIRNTLNLKKKVIHYSDNSAVKTENIGGTQVTHSSCENRLHFVIMCCQVDGNQVPVVGGSTLTTIGNMVMYFKDP